MNETSIELLVFIGIFFDPEDADNTLLRNMDELKDYTVSYPRRHTVNTSRDNLTTRLRAAFWDVMPRNLQTVVSAQIGSTWHVSNYLPYRTVPPDDTRAWSSWRKENLQGKPNYTQKTCPGATLPYTNHTRPELGSKPGRRRGKPANRLSYKAVRGRNAVTRYQAECQASVTEVGHPISGKTLLTTGSFSGPALPMPFMPRLHQLMASTGNGRGRTPHSQQQAH
jgi:hypothetical protein